MTKKFILTAACALFAADAFAAQKPEFSSLDFASQVSVVSAAAQAAPAAIPAPVCAKARIGRYVQVSGYVTLTGNGWMPQGGGYTSVSLTGWATFRDSSGQITSNNTYINTSASLWVKPNQSVFQTVWPNVYAQFSRNGKPLGSANMTGSVSLSGWPSSSYFSLNGSGYLSGSIYVEDEQ
ncbi:MAG TPA: hypothetical protein PKI19_01300 [Elusimicrobiales bacterium]|nr:hypothetical protein [Elusimicrobiales bacterium]